MTMTLSKIVPQRRCTIEFNWVKSDFMLFGTFRVAREKRMGLRGMDKCFWCKKPFADADMMALAQPTSGANRVLCQGCASGLSPLTEHYPGCGVDEGTHEGPCDCAEKRRRDPTAGGREP